jgi:hypothetical protein
MKVYLLPWITAMMSTAALPLAAGTTFEDDVTFMKRHTDVLVLEDETGQARVAVVPAYQGRIMTSSARGNAGRSHGWVNRELIASGSFVPHINVFGGEDRFWLGPEGGQYSIFFAPNVPFDLAHWFTPASIDTEPFALTSQTRDRAVFHRELALTNYSGTVFQLRVDREVRLVAARPVLERFGTQLPAGVAAVGFESVNTVRNTGPSAWTQDGGLLSIWILGMFNASPQTTAVIPFVPGPESALGPVVNDRYFGKVPPDRLVIRDGTIFFRADADYRSKIGVSSARAWPLMGSYDAAHQVLTLVWFTLPPGARDYVNSMWELQDQPFRGDAVNSYNDGPPAPGAKQLGRFYELESSSPALALAPGESAVHVHQTLHLEGSEAALDPIARQCLGVSLEAIKSAFGR